MTNLSTPLVTPTILKPLTIFTVNRPLSLSPSPLSSLGDYSYKNLLEDDFETGKVSLRTDITSYTGGIASYRGTYSMDSKQTSQDTIFQFGWGSKYLWFGTRPSEMKLHIDLGEFDFIKKQNFFINFKATQDSQEWRVGTVYNGPNLLQHTSFEYQINNIIGLSTDKNANWTALSRSLFKQQEHTFASVNEYQFKTGKLNKYDLMYGYFTKDADFFLRHLSQEVPNIPICCGFGVGRLVADLVFRNKQNTFGTELSYNGYTMLGLALGISSQLNNTTVKAKFDVFSQLISLSAKGDLYNTLGYTLSTQVSLRENKGTYGPFPIPIGASLYINI